MEASRADFKVVGTKADATGTTPSLQAEPSTEGVLLCPRGDWTLEQLHRVEATLRKLLGEAAGPVTVDMTQVGRLDTAGALLLHGAHPPGVELDTVFKEPRSAHRRLLQAVADAREDQAIPREDIWGFEGLFLHVGQNIYEAMRELWLLLGFVGYVLANIADCVRNPRRLRIAPILYQFEEVGIEATPIVALLSFMVGAVVAFLGAQIMVQFGAEIFVVELVGYAFLREFGVVLTAIMIAGRSGSAFTAQIGAMKVNEEVDAMETIGVRAMDALILPRIFGLLLAMPLLVFIADVFGILGGLLVSWAVLDISPGMFFVRFANQIGIEQFWVGMVKAPFFAVLIALIGCMQGLRVTGSARSVGENTTKSVVQSIFLVIVVDALFAMFFLEINV